MISPDVRESKTVLDSRFQVLDSECFVSETWILDSLSCELDICRIHVEEYHEPVFALSSRLFCHL